MMARLQCVMATVYTVASYLHVEQSYFEQYCRPSIFLCAIHYADQTECMYLVEIFFIQV